MIDIGNEKVEVDREVLLFVARNEGTTIDTIRRRLHMPGSVVKSAVSRLRDRCAVTLKPGRNEAKVYIARMSDTVEDCLMQIRALASRGIMAAKDTAPVMEL